jgi:hypothetical protein
LTEARAQQTAWRTGLVGVTIVGVLIATSGAMRAQAPSTAQKGPTFARDVAPIFQEKCQTCHRPGQMAPMSLLTFEDARPWARAIKTKVEARDMPPWHLDKTVGIKKFVNDISLSDAQIETIVKWVDAGAPLGDPKDLPAPKQWPNADQWRLAESQGRAPDLVIKSTPWTQPAQGQDQWWQPVVDSGNTEDRWIRAVEVRPSLKGRRIVHHGNSALAEFGVGKEGEIYGENTGKLLKAGEKVSFDIHYHSVGEAITDQLEVGLWFYPKGYVPKYQVKGTALGVFQSMDTFDLPPGKVTVHHGYLTLNEPTKILSYQPHMHMRGKAMSIEAIYPDGRVEMLSNVDHFNFNWHVNYVYADDVAPVLPKGTVLHITAWHDNTAANKSNPDPRQWVGWGQRSFDDMYHAHMRMISLSEEDYQQIIQERKKAAVTNTAQQ